MDHARLWSIKLPRLAALLGCTEAELLAKIGEQGDALYGKPLGPSNAATTVDLSYPPPEPDGGMVTRQALISTVSSDRYAVPRCALVSVGGHALLAHLVRQLLDGGVRRVVLVARVGEAAVRVRQAVSEAALPAPPLVRIEIVEVGPLCSGYTGSLMSAHDALDTSDPYFLLACSERAFQPQLVRTLAGMDMPPGSHARLSIETEADYYSAEALPRYFLRARLDAYNTERVLEVGSSLSDSLPLLTGLALLDHAALSAVFKARLGAAAEGRAGASALADLLNVLASESALVAQPTNGLLWLAHETSEQLSESCKVLAHGIGGNLPPLPPTWSPPAAEPGGGAVEVSAVEEAEPIQPEVEAAVTDVASGPLARVVQPTTLPPGVHPAGASTEDKDEAALGRMVIGLGVKPPAFGSERISIGALQQDDAAIATAAAAASTIARESDLPAAAVATGAAAAAVVPMSTEGGPVGMLCGRILDASPSPPPAETGAGGGGGTMTCSSMLTSREPARAAEQPYALAMSLPSALAAEHTSLLSDDLRLSRRTDDEHASAPAPFEQVSGRSGEGGATAAEAFLIELPRSDGGGEQRHVVAFFDPQSADANFHAGDGAREGGGARGGATGGDESRIVTIISGEEDVNAFWRRVGLPPLPSGIDSVTISCTVSAAGERRADYAQADAQRFALSAEPPVRPARATAAVQAPPIAAQEQPRLVRAEASAMPVYSTLPMPPGVAEREAVALSRGETSAERLAAPSAYVSPLLLGDSRQQVVAPGEEPREQGALMVELVVKRRVPWVGWAVLLCALLAQASSGIALRQVQGPSALTVLFWRLSLIAIVYALPTVFSIAASKKLRSVLAGARVPALLIVAACGATFQFGCFVIALQATSQSNALLFNNMAPLVLLVLKVIRSRGASLQTLEVGGAAVAVLGGLVVTANSVGMAAQQQDETKPANHELMGDAIALCGSVGSAIYLLANAKIRPLLPAPVQFGLLYLLAALLVMPIALTVGIGGPPAAFDASRDGLFGWVRPEVDRLGVAVYVVIVCDSIGTLGWIVSLRYFTPLTVSVMILLLPIAAVVEGAFTGLEETPSLLTILGMLILIVGATEVVLASSVSTEERIDASSALADPMVRSAVDRASSRTLRSGGNEPTGAGAEQAPLLPDLLRGAVQASDSNAPHHDIELAHAAPRPLAPGSSMQQPARPPSEDKTHTPHAHHRQMF